jgi:hypothetical protein
MLLSRKDSIWLTCIILFLLLMAPPVIAEMSMSERSLPVDTVIADTFQAGSGLPVGKIQSVRGEILIFHRDPSVGYRAQTGLPLYQGDILYTRKNSRIFCRLVDGSRVAMAPGTRLTLRQSNSNSARKSSLSFLSLKQGRARFYVNPRPEFSTVDFKVQTETAFVQAQAADFVIKADPGKTEISAFENSRLEVTSLAEPEEIHFLSDYQRAVFRQQSAPPVVETVSATDAEVLMAEFRLVPDNTLFASGSTDSRVQDITEETLDD